MVDIVEANEILRKFPYPLTTVLKFSERRGIGEAESADPYLFWESGKTRIIIRQPFFFSTQTESACVDGEASFRKIENRSVFEVHSMAIDDLGILIVDCGECKFRCLPGVQYGWGIYVDGRELIQHYGWSEGIEFDDQLKFSGR